MDERRDPCLWYQLGEGDQDLATFFYYAGLAVRKMTRTRRPLPLLTSEYLQDIPIFSRRFFEKAFSLLKPSSVLVFDNYQLIPEESGLHEVLLRQLSEIPDGLHVIFISRSAPPGALIRLRANGLMEMLGWDELRLTLAEAAGIIRLRSRKIRSKRMIQDLHKGADGWAVGLILMLEGVKRGVEPRLLARMPPEEILHYFGNELFDQLNAQDRDFFLKTAFLPKLTAKMAEDLTGAAHAGLILSSLSRRNYFTHMRPHAEPVYEYHPLFREFLMSRAKEVVPADVLTPLIRRAGKLLDEAGQTEAAAELIADLRDWEELARLVVKHASALVAQGRGKLIENWVSRYPQEGLEKRPWLLYWLGVCKLTHSPTEARLLLGHAFQCFDANQEFPGTFLAWAGVVDSILYEWNEFNLLDSWIDWLDRRMALDPTFPSPEIEAKVTSSMTGAILWRQTSRPDIETWLNQALQSSRKIGDRNLLLQNTMWAIMYYNWRGDVPRLTLLFEESKRVALAPSASPLAAMMWRFAEATYGHMAASIDPVRPVLKALEIGRIHGVHVMDLMLLSHGVYGSLCLDDIERAEEFLQKISSMLQEGKRDPLAHYHFLSGWLHLVKGDMAQAAFHSEAALELAEKSGYPVPESLCRHLKAHVFHRRGEDRQASAQLNRIREFALNSGCLLFEYVALLSEAEFALDQGEEAACVDALSRAMALGRKQDITTMLFLWRPFVMARLCAKALENGVEVEYVRHLIRTFRLPPDPHSLKIESWPWPVKIYALGRFELTRDNLPLRPSRKAQEKPLSILKVLIAWREREIKAEDISDVLWPEADGDAAHHSLQVTIHRLRLLLGCPEALSFRDGRVALNSRYCYVDAWAYEQLLDQADLRWREGRTDSAVQLAEKALSLYRGPFLNTEGEHAWAISTSERLRNRFLRGVGRLGGYWSQKRQWEKACDCYQKGFDVDDLAEGFCQGLMQCYQHLGRRAEALVLYQRFEERLRKVLGAEPSEKTKALRDALLKSRPT
jgi:DNA-binding SARP family transcriptional activator